MSKKTTILLVRHGFSVSNEKGTFTGQLDEPLSEVGKCQAKLLTEFVLETYSVDEIYSSPLSRAFDTVKGVADALGKEILKEPAFMEIYGGEWEGKTAEEIEKLFPFDYAFWKEDMGSGRCTGGETGEELIERAYARLNEIAKENLGKTIVVGAHAGVIRALQCKIRGLLPEEMREVAWTTNASVTEIEFDGDKGYKEIKISQDGYLKGLITKLKSF